MSDHQHAPFDRDTVKHAPRVRSLAVARVHRATATIARLTFTGELDGFAASGFDDHVKAFFPDGDGRIVAPELVDGKLKRTGRERSISRDYTVRAFRPADGDGPAELDIDFVLHGVDATRRTAPSCFAGPASRWAAAASPGDPLVIAGPKRSRLAPHAVESLVVIADETAFPAAARLLEEFGTVPATCFLVSDIGADARAYFADRTGPTDFEWFGYADASAIETAVRSLRIHTSTFVFAAGEKSMLSPLRRYFKKELALPKRQVDAHGYWKR